MSVFRRIKRGRDAAKEHAQKEAERKKIEAEKPAYRHIPTHAAVDALAGAPGGWRQEDRVRIIEENRRRTMMTANASAMGMTMVPGVSPLHMGMPRVNSALSYVSYPSAYANPVVQMPRTYSYQSLPPTAWGERQGEFTYPPVIASNMSVKGKEAERPPVMVDSGRASQSSSKGNTSPVGSSNNSTSSQDDLELKPAKRPSVPPNASRSGNLRLPANRRTSDPPPVVERSTSQTRASYSNPPRPAPVQRTPSAAAPSNGLAEGPPIPALHPGRGFSLSKANSGHTSAQSSTSAASSVTLAPTSNFFAGFNFDLPKPITLAPLNNETSPSAEPAVQEAVQEAAPVHFIGHAGVPAGPPAPLPDQRPYRMSKTPRFTEMDTTPTMAHGPPVASYSVPPQAAQTRVSVNPTTLPTSFDDSAVASVGGAAPPPSRGKLTKNPGGGNKLVKKGRWSILGSKQAATVAY